MSYIFTDLKTKLKTQIGDPNLDDSIMGDALNYTQQSIFNTFDLTLNSEQQTNTVTAGTNVTGSLPTDFQRISSLFVVAPVGTQRDITNYFMPVKEFRTHFPLPSTFGAGHLSNWTLWKVIEFSNNADITYTLTLDYIKSIPILSAASDVPIIPQAFEELLILGAKMRVYAQKEDFDYANQFTNSYADLVEAFTTRYSTRQMEYQVVIPGARGRVSG